MTQLPQRLRSASKVVAFTVASALFLSCANAIADDTPASTSPTKRRGEYSAPVQIVLYSDFECPFCAVLTPTLEQLLAKRQADVSLEFRHFPLSFHAHAQVAHEAAEFAAQQGKFWEFHDRLFANRRALDRESLLKHATAVGLDAGKLAASLEAGEFRSTVAASVDEGERRGVSGTPAMFINGRQVSGAVPLDRLERLVDEALGITTADTPMTVQARAIEPGRVQGPPDAPVRVEVFVDLGSPLAGRAIRIANDVSSRYPTSVALMFRHRPTGLYPASPALHAQAERFIADGTLWTRLPGLASAPPPGGSGIVGTPQESPSQVPGVSSDVAEAERLGIRGAPAFVVAGQRFDGLPTLQALATAVEAALRTR